MGKLVFTFLGFTLFLFFFLIYSGLFADIELKEKRTEERWIIYETHQGNYANSKTVLEYVEGSLYMEGAVKHSKTFGLYLDNPKTVETKDLRSIVGVIIDDPTENLIIYLQTRYKVAKLPTCFSAVIEFPYKNIFSIFIGMARVYPVYERYFEEQKFQALPIMEVYDKENDLIIYSSPSNMKEQLINDIYDNNYKVFEFKKTAAMHNI